MRRIIFNQARFPKTDIKEKISELYDDYLKMNGQERDIAEVVKYSRDFYLSENAFPSEDMIREKFKFEFEQTQLSDEIKFSTYLIDKTVEFRERRRKDLTLSLLKEGQTSEKRQEILDELVRIETDIFNDEKDEITKIEDLKMVEIYDRFKNRGSGIRTNIPDIDAVTMGISSGKIAVIFAPPGGFKTSAALNMTYLNVMDGDNTLSLSLEITKDEYKSMILVRHSYTMGINLPMLKIVKGLLSPEEEKQLYIVEKDFNEKKKGTLIIMDTDDLRIDTLISFKTQLKDIVIKEKIKTVYIDFMQQFKDFDVKGFDDERMLMNKIVSILRYMSVTMDVRIIILSQSNRAGFEYADRNGGSMKMSNISEISNLERYAYYIISLYSNDELKLGNQLKAGLIKHRGGETIQEAKFTKVIPQYFVVGDINQSYAEMLSYQAAKDAGGFDAISIFK